MGVCGLKDAKKPIQTPKKDSESSKISQDFIKLEQQVNQQALLETVMPKALGVQNQSDKRYKVGDVIAYGSQIQFYEGFDTNTGQLIAIKTIKLYKDHEKKSKQIDSIKEEIALIKSLKHRNIVQYKYRKIYEDEDKIDIVFEYGRSLRQILNENEGLEESIVRNYTKQILECLSFLHLNWVVHRCEYRNLKLFRDINCSSLLIESDGTVKLMNFGSLIRIIPKDQTSQSQSPDMINLARIICKADIQALGGCIIEMLTGKPPNLQRIQEQKPTFPPKISQNLSEFLDEIYIVNPFLRPSADNLLKSKFIIEIPQQEDCKNNEEKLKRFLLINNLQQDLGLKQSKQLNLQRMNELEQALQLELDLRKQ